MEIELILGEMLKLGRKPDLDKLSKLLRNRGVSKALGSVELLNRQLKEKPLKLLKPDDEYWETSEEYLEELQARVKAGVLVAGEERGEEG